MALKWQELLWDSAKARFLNGSETVLKRGKTSYSSYVQSTGPGIILTYIQCIFRTNILSGVEAIRKKGLKTIHE